MKRIFRSLLMTALTLYVGWLASFYFAYSMFSENVANALTHHGSEAWIYIPEVASWILPSFWVIATVGMWQFSQGARIFYLVLTISSVALSAVSGMSIQSGPQAAVAEIISAIDGAILAIAYFTSVDNEFRKTASNH